MDVNSGEVSAVVVTMLTPFMPYLLNAAKFSAAAIGEMMVQKGGEDAWQRARTIWDRISSRYSDDGVINGAATMLAAQPENEQFQSTFACELAVRLQEDQALLSELKVLIGGQETIQKVLAENSWIEDVTQKISRASGTQIIQATDNSIIHGVKQNIKQ